MPCIGCACPEGKCDCAKSTSLVGASLLAHVPCLVALVLSALGMGTAFAANIHRFVPLLFLVSIGCIIWSFSRLRKANTAGRIIVIAASVIVLALWYPHRHHIIPWSSHGAMGHMDHHMPM